MFIASLNVVLCSLELSVVQVLFECSAVFLPIFGKIMGFGQKFARAAKGGASKENVGAVLLTFSWSSDAWLSF